MIVLHTSTPEDTFALGIELGAQLRSGDSVLLAGDLGAGKSVLARAVASSLGVKGPMPSPTFTLMQPYDGRVPVSHFDLYRLDDPDEFFAAGLDEYMGGAFVSLIEWPLDGIDANPAIHIRIDRGANDNARQITIDFVGMDEKRQADIVFALKPWEVKK